MRTRSMEEGTITHTFWSAKMQDTSIFAEHVELLDARNGLHVELLEGRLELTVVLSS
jgi:hypothetical protein